MRQSVRGSVEEGHRLSRSRHAAVLAGLAVWIGLLTGLLEGMHLWVRQATLGQVVFASRHVLWMTPLSYALLFAGVGACLAVGVQFVPARFRTRTGLFLLVALGVFILALPFGQISRYAIALLAGGIAAQVTRIVSSRPAHYLRRARVVSIFVVLVALIMGGWSWSRRQLELRSLRSVASASRDVPSVLLVIWDTVRAQSLSLHGYDQPTTPGLERLASSSVVFDRAISTSPWTLPGHASMFTGRHPFETSASWEHRLDGTHPTIAESFLSAGYATGGFVANHHYTSYDSGLDRGFERYRDYKITLRQILASSALRQTPFYMRMSRGIRTLDPVLIREAVKSHNLYVPVKRGSDPKHADEVNREFLTWLDGLDDRPFFAFLNYFDAHKGYWSPPGYHDRFTRRSPPINDYDAAIAYLDDELAALVEALGARGRLDNTVVIFSSDHGELFGEHGLNGHATSLYMPVLHVPLLLRFPARVPSGRRVDAEISLRDLAVTVLDLARVRGQERFPGRSLARYWDESVAASDRADGRIAADPPRAEVARGRNNPDAPIDRGDMRSLVADGLHYILNGDDVEELYDYVADPGEESNLAGTVVGREPLERMRETLSRLVGEPAVVAASPGRAGIDR